MILMSGRWRCPGCGTTIEDSFGRGQRWCDDCGGEPAVLGDFVLGRDTTEIWLENEVQAEELRDLFESDED